MTTKFTTATTRGQITLPAPWRRQFKTNNFSINIHPEKLEITPIYEENLIFSAERDNDGEGVEINEFIEALEKSLQD